jgi:hypothetical protein
MEYVSKLYLPLAAAFVSMASASGTLYINLQNSIDTQSILLIGNFGF